MNGNKIPLPKVYYDNSRLSPNNSFKILQLHAQSLRNKLHLLEGEISKFDKPAVVIVSETWMIEGWQQFYNIDGYILSCD